MDYILKGIIDYIAYFFPLILLVVISGYLALFGRVDRSDEQKSFTHKISKKH